MAEVLVADTHALLWHMTGQRRKLGPAARRAFDRAESGGTPITVPAVSLVEILDADARGRLRLAGGFRAWLERLRAHPAYVTADLTPDVVRRSSELLSIPNRADRLIAATAVHLGGVLLSRDPDIEAAGIERVW